jgi:hypothetical protein
MRLTDEMFSLLVIPKNVIKLDIDLNCNEYLTDNAIVYLGVVVSLDSCQGRA